MRDKKAITAKKSSYARIVERPDPFGGASTWTVRYQGSWVLNPYDKQPRTFDTLEDAQAFLREKSAERGDFRLLEYVIPGFNPKGAK